MTNQPPFSQTSRELALMPRGDHAQNMFRMVFNARRQNSLGAYPEGRTDLRSVFEEAKKSVRVMWPDFEPEYDPSLFD